MTRHSRFRVRHILKWSALGMCVVYAITSPAFFLMLPVFWALAFLTAILWTIDGQSRDGHATKSSAAGRVAKWVWLLACPSILAAWLTTAWFPTLYFADRYYVYLGNARVAISMFAGDPDLATQYVNVNQRSWRQGPRMRGAGWRGVFDPVLRENLWKGRVPGTLNGRDLEVLIEHRIILPIWLIFLGAFTMSVLLWRRELRRMIRREYPPGHCQTCGYDLTGNTSGRCPECGTPVAAFRVGSADPTAEDVEMAAACRSRSNERVSCSE